MMMKIQTKGQRILVVSFSVLIITHGREELLSKCLESLRPNIPFELVLFANGLSLSDEFLKKLETFPGTVKISASSIQLSPGEARNKAFLETSGEWVHLIDDDSYWQKGYWEICAKHLADPKIEVLGGPDGPASPASYFQESVSIALSSPVCTGLTFARHKGLGKSLIPATEEKLTSCNLWLRRGLLEKHSFPEDFRRAEETFFLQELQKENRRMFYHPLMKVGHFRRKSLSDLIRPTIGAGYWRSRLLRKHRGDGAMFYLPSAFVLLHLIFFMNPKLGIELAQIYVFVVLFISMGLSSRGSRFFHFPMVAFLHYFIVSLYGIGFLLERVGYKWKS
jgi:glycosyltransferase involved in cell wall biosynthesis